MKIEVTNYKKIAVSAAKPGDVVEVNENFYLVINPDASVYVNRSDFEKRTMLANLTTGEMIAPINSVLCVVIKTAKLSLTI